VEPDQAAVSRQATRRVLTPRSPSELISRKGKAMKVRDVLGIKGSTVVSVAAAATVRNTLRLFAEEKIGCATVMDAAGRTIGLVSERDICNAIAAAGEGAVRAPVRDVMQKQIVICTPDDYLAKVMALMTEKRTRHVLVMDGETVAGIVSIGDVVKHRLDEAIKDEETMLEYIQGTGYGFSSHTHT